MANNPWIFITGGVRSGKSQFAERCAKALKKQYESLVYVATGVAFDEEMTRRIAHHKRLREGEGWLTIERPTDFYLLREHIPERSVILWDCVTTWLGNECYEVSTDGMPAWQNEDLLQNRINQMFIELQMLHDAGHTLIVVSNEVLDAGIPNNEETYVYMKNLGRIHCEMVKRADVAIEMTYKATTFWKGATIFEKYMDRDWTRFSIFHDRTDS
ncbi:bifunctional adenosylcobinamide kinase/adenosylcobinamide-phosphate guanylyltransferase [Kurthia senegalensis]|uniref:bifunctional adenosylcobinamide kinase/adenosylcobinamide-phosphate guanylyltransferase n=1 Tax=Kurthia senegalensis TaxID=1033740 RepID=UPI0002887D90|nr:bifunctional adenosylcobinamide kinase/adenosylcobinamide-phosphate guanylyltransferase [Kurthia senegalensis]